MNEQEIALCTELVIANRIMANENVLDAFGHVSVRHPERSRHFLMSCSRAPELIECENILEYGPDSQPVIPDDKALYIERFIHGEIYRARPDVNAICHHHAAAIMPFCITGVRLVPVYQHGAMLGTHVPLWDSRDEFGDTNMLVTNSEQGASLARALGPYGLVLMRHHGATGAARSLRELVFRSITACRNAEFQYSASLLGRDQGITIEGLTEGEIAKGGNVSPSAIARALTYWQSRLPTSPDRS
jgi:ribulose-5-phosphate 4-epimerase/fuculose-1-phosphate aldolase